MNTVITEEIKKLIEDKESVKVLATVGKEGNPHVVVKGSIFVNEDGNLEYLELLEGSKTNKNLLYSLWFEKDVEVNVITRDGRSLLIAGRPVKNIFTGHEYQEKYEEAQKRDPENDLSSLWIIEPYKIVDETYQVRRTEEAEIHPIYAHLDRLAK